MSSANGVRLRLDGLAIGSGFPRLISVDTPSPDEAHVVMGIGSELCWFRGHFPGNPVLPGVVQLHWAVTVSRAAFDFAQNVSEVRRLKFSRVVTPPSQVDLVVTRQGEHEARFTFSSGGDRNSEGSLIFAERGRCIPVP